MTRLDMIQGQVPKFLLWSKLMKPKPNIQAIRPKDWRKGPKNKEGSNRAVKSAALTSNSMAVCPRQVLRDECGRGGDSAARRHEKLHAQEERWPMADVIRTSNLFLRSFTQNRLLANFWQQGRGTSTKGGTCAKDLF